MLNEVNFSSNSSSDARLAGLGVNASDTAIRGALAQSTSLRSLAAWALFGCGACAGTPKVGGVHPLPILSGLPFAGFGALVALMVFQLDLSIYAFVGVIMLVGIVKKNAIMMIDFAIEAERNEGTTARQAILQAASVRFRPIMMTTMAALVGTLPIALGHGAGAESRRPLGVAVVGGLIFSQIITLYITPVVYTYLDAWQKRLARRRTSELGEYSRSGAGEPRAVEVPG